MKALAQTVLAVPMPEDPLTECQPSKIVALYKAGVFKPYRWAFRWESHLLDLDLNGGLSITRFHYQKVEQWTFESDCSMEPTVVQGEKI